VVHAYNPPYSGGRDQDCSSKPVQANSSQELSQKNPSQKRAACLLQHCSQGANYGNSQDAPLLMNELRKCGIYTQWNFIQPQRRMKFCHSQVNGWKWRTSS
jgi:hypothetical protein